jgi:predicted AlkP superfamily phosphohydrolase/phosphomutase
MDGVVGRALESADDRTLLLAVSDHGFGSFRRQFNLNGWLMDHGYAAPAAGVERGAGSYFSEIDWSGTRAYGLGINGLYLNVKGREHSGIVTRSDIETEAATLAQRLRDIRDPNNGEPVIHRVCRPSEIYSGPCLNGAPDLLVCYAPNYRASWDTILGGYPRETLLDNLDPWSGDHAIDSLFMSGVMLANRPMNVDRPGLEDMAPTLLNWFGLKPAPGMTGRVFSTESG